MMRILRVFISAALMAAVFVLALPAAADGCPPPGQSPGDGAELDCRLSPLQSRQVNPYSSLATGGLSSLDDVSTRLAAHFSTPLSLGDGSRSGSSPVFVDQVPIASGSGAPPFGTLDLRMRYQDPSDVSCGVQALGMALDGLGPPGPASSAMLGYLQGQGMMYDFGTGVEELAFTAQSYGYADSQPFYGGSLAQLQSELAAGRPVVVDLGANGEGQPGHFVTVTGISPDGKWVAFNDPILGKQVLPASDFLSQWSLQGYSGVSVGPSAAHTAGGATGTISAATPEPNPLNASPLLILAAGIMALITNAGLGLKRLGVGGMLAQGTGGGGGGKKPVAKPAKSSTKSSSSNKKKDKKKAAKPPAPAPEPAPAPGQTLLGGLQSGAMRLLSTVTSAASDVADAARTTLNQVAASAVSASSHLVNRLETSVRSAAAAVADGLNDTLDAMGSLVSNAAEAVAATAVSAASLMQSELEDLKRATTTSRGSSGQTQSTPSPARAPKPPQPPATPVPPGAVARSEYFRIRSRGRDGITGRGSAPCAG